MRYTGPKNRIARREAMDLGFKTVGTKSHALLLKKLNVPPGQHGGRGRRKTSEHSRQLREKQKLRYMFGITETKLSNYFKEAIKKPGNTASYLSQYLETRLDNVVFRLGLAPTRASSRQLVSHNHIKVNNRVVNVASYEVKVGDVISFADEKTLKIPMVEQSIARKDYIMPTWLEKQGVAGKLSAEPNSEALEKQINLRLVIEFYSR
jgi:small subunit ribosomal protein S4